MQNFTFTFTLDQTNQIMMALAKQPFETVVDLIEEIKKQAQPQIQEAPAAPAPVIEEVK